MLLKSAKLSTKIIGGLCCLVFFIVVVMIVISGNQTPKITRPHYLSDNASADNKVEALKMMTANLLAMQAKNKSLSAAVTELKTDNQAIVDNLKQSIRKQLSAATQEIKQQQRPITPAPSFLGNSAYPINTGKNISTLTWVKDIAKSPERLDLPQTKNHTKPKAQPQYTIPLNATLTGATLMTPLIGRVPIDGKLPSPYHFKLVLSAENLTANGYPLPGVKGAVMSGVASGDLLASCARGNVNSMTFIFQDGRISTTESKDEDHPLGTLSNQQGNPCLNGTFHSNAALFLGTSAALAGLAGYAKGITQSQYMRNTTGEGNSISTLIGRANRAGAGEGLGSAASAAQTWWDRRVNNSFDYVFVPNIDLSTHKPRRVSINICQSIPIDYNNAARKVSYEAIHHNLQSLD